MTRNDARSNVQCPRIALFGLFGIGNLGNEATLWVTLYHLRRRLPHAEILCISDAIPACAKEYRVKGLPLDPLPIRGVWRLPSRLLRYLYLASATLITEPIRRRRAARMLNGADRFIVVGTGALDDLGEMPWGMPAWLLRWTQAARISGATSQLLAVGAGPIKGVINRFLMLRAITKTHIRSYRDTFSLNYIASLGVAGSSDRVVPDLCFAVPQECLPAPRRANCPPRVVGVGVMAYFGWNLGPAQGRRVYNEYIDKLAQFVSWLLTSGYQVRLLVGERGTDEGAVRDLLQVLGDDARTRAGQRLAAVDINSVGDLLSEIMATDVVVASRFHNLVFALALGRPVISIGYAAKFDALMQEMSLWEYRQYIESLDVERLKAQFRDLADKHADAVQTVSEKVMQYRACLDAVYDAAFPATL